MKFLVLVLGSVAAYLIIRFRKGIYDFIGDIGFAESVFGSGGTYTFIVLFGILIFVGSVMYFFGTLQGILQATIGVIF